jgi:hypothetical protein
MTVLENLSRIHFRTSDISLTTPNIALLVGLRDRLGPENDPKLLKMSRSQRVYIYNKLFRPEIAS